MDIISLGAAVSQSKDYTDTKISSIGSGLTYKGSVARVADLPSTGNVKGDMYNISTGGAYVWNGTAWTTLISDTGIYIGTVESGDSFPTVRPDGTALQKGDYVKPTGTFPFTIESITFTSARDKAYYSSNSWNLDAFILQNTQEVTVNNSTTESISGSATNQAAINIENKTAINSKSTVSVSNTGTAINKIKYITIDGVEKKIGGGTDDVDNLSTENKNDKLQVKNYDQATQGQMPVKDATNGIVWINPISMAQLDAKVQEASGYSNQASIYSTQAGNYATQALNAKNAIDNKIWFGTLEEYNALTEVLPTTLYIITDSNVISTIGD